MPTQMTTTSLKPSSSRAGSGPALPKRLAHALGVVAETLPNPWDESTDYFTPFSAALADDQPMTPETLRVALQVGDRYHLDIGGADWASVADNAEGALAEGYRMLDKIMSATLTDLSRVFARAPGVVRVRTWVVGRLAGGWLVGLRTETTET